MRAVLSRPLLALVAVILPRACAAPASDAPAPSAPVPVPASAPTIEPPAPTASAEPSNPACPADMVLVEGNYLPAAGHRCVSWIDESRDRCRNYAAPPLTSGRPVAERFCIDRFEYPNLAGVTPVVMVDWLEANDACHDEGKRLCLSSEWTLACEGNEIRPYPYGYERDPSACNIDRPRPVPEPDFQAFSHPRQIEPEVLRLDLRVTSGEMKSCVSPFGARDMTGNVDEWVINEHHFDTLQEDQTEDERPYVSGLKGGYWGPIRSRCRPMTTAHNEWFRFYQVGFRCCADPLDGSFRGQSLERSLPKNPKHLPRMD